MSENSLVIFTKASQMLAEADTIQKAKELKSLALTAADWAKRKGMGEEAIQHARSYALEAERKMGEMLAQTERNKGAKPGKTGHKALPLLDDKPTLAALGLTKRESAEAQRLAGLPEETFEAVKAGKKTRAEIKRQQQRNEYEKKVAEYTPPKLSVIPSLVLADPPWKYEFSETKSRKVENQYDTASIDDLVKHCPKTQKDAVCFMWATAPKLREAMALLFAWGFEYRTHAIWDKCKIGMGYWFRGQHELLLVGTKGKFSPPLDVCRVSSIFQEPRGQHSAKPSCVYEWIEKAFPMTSKLEMYSRSKRSGWSTWGNQ